MPARAPAGDVSRELTCGERSATQRIESKLFKSIAGASERVLEIFAIVVAVVMLWWWCGFAGTLLLLRTSCLHCLYLCMYLLHTYGALLMLVNNATARAPSLAPRARSFAAPAHCTTTFSSGRSPPVSSSNIIASSLPLSFISGLHPQKHHCFFAVRLSASSERAASAYSPPLCSDQRMSDLRIWRAGKRR
ncbi:hypothetical protein IWX90DRAFT_233267 [Phyllosticta citrichinensis]|uniref:Uncharacterized protein n=1 Tax=Phyllosticta citrichinensis TaxID=1130410 RepID=A0ABR1XUZ3_9PEZI